ncbi:MAG: Formylglycine-generating enzyme, required for sulfatase activity [Verrucomicrobia bacterium]|nr:MAG: Formylglycine-generating enzyme, required for sulfatase activity [Verrucomicrobiota bacterium]
MSPRKPVVIISSTYKDLKEYRKKAFEVCRRLGFDPLGMEDATADTEPPVDVCKRWVDQADIYVGIYAFWYGTIPPGETRSITEMEYDWASERGIPRLLFLAEQGPWDTRFIDFDHRPELNAFKERVATPDAHTRATFNSVDNFGLLLSQALMKYQTGGSPDQTDLIHPYLERLASEAGFIEMFRLGQDIQLVLPISDVYVDLGMQAVHSMGTVEAEGREDHHALGKADRLEDLSWDQVMQATFSRSAKTGKRAICILGEPGAGKTTVAKKIAWELASGSRLPQDFGLEPGTVPVLLRFRDLSAQEISEAGGNLLRHWAVARTTDSEGNSPGEALCNRGKVLWILDGLDEVVSAPMRHEVLQFLQRVINERFPRGDRFLITSRFSGVGGEAKLPVVFQEFHVKPLPWEQVERFVGRWFATAMEALSLDPAVGRKKTEDLLQILRQDEYQHDRLRSLCFNPLLLTILCVVFHRNAHLPRSRAGLYDQCVNVLLSYWRQGGFDSAKARDLLSRIAWHLHGEDDRTHAPREELAALVDVPVREFNDPRLGENGDQFITQMWNSCGILASAGQGKLGFLHLTFQEYLAASHALREGLVADVAERAPVKWWRETAVLLLTAPESSQTAAETFYRVLMGQDLADPLVMQILTQCLEEGNHFPAQPVLEQLRCRDDAGRLKLLQALQSRSRLPESVLDPLGELAQSAGSGTDLRRMANLLLARQGREIVEEPGQELWVDPQAEITFVRIPDRDFWIAAHPVTNDQYGKFLKATRAKTPEYWNNSQFNGPRQPVVGIDWHEAKRFCEWVGAALPTEEQWEHACRAGSTTGYCFGDDEARLAEYAWYDKNSEGRTHDVGTLKPNAWGLYDMHGNVWEWCADRDGEYRVLRGGAWDYVARFCRSASRCRYGPDSRSNDFGFRPVRMKKAEGPAPSAAAVARADGRDPEPRRGFFGGWFGTNR